jgi:hypothetical protein
MKRMDAVRLGCIADRWTARGLGNRPILFRDAQELVGDMQALVQEVRMSHMQITGLMVANERLREQLASEGREDCLLSREASDRALRLTGCMEDAE